jgi:hypothetical protein
MIFGQGMPVTVPAGELFLYALAIWGSALIALLVCHRLGIK